MSSKERINPEEYDLIARNISQSGDNALDDFHEVKDSITKELTRLNKYASYKDLAALARRASQNPDRPSEVVSADRAIRRVSLLQLRDTYRFARRVRKIAAKGS